MAKLIEKSIHDIIDRRQRLSEPDMAAGWRMSSSVQTFNYPLRHRDELLRYFPIGVVASIDGYFRSRLAQLIDSGEPFSSNAVAAYPNVSLDATLAAAIASRRVSLGELLMLSVVIGSFDGLIQMVAKITGVKDFLGDLEKVKPARLLAKPGDRVILDPKTTWGHLGKVFTLRHILCHELAADIELNEQEIRNLLLMSQQFMTESAQWLQKLQHPHPPPSPKRRAANARKVLSNTATLRSPGGKHDARYSTSRLSESPRVARGFALLPDRHLRGNLAVTCGLLIRLIGRRESTTAPKPGSGHLLHHAANRNGGRCRRNHQRQRQRPGFHFGRSLERGQPRNHPQWQSVVGHNSAG